LTETPISICLLDLTAPEEALWNEEFQQILEHPAVTKDQIKDRMKLIDGISKRYEAVWVG
jgi:hypothetical protein